MSFTKFNKCVVPLVMIIILIVSMLPLQAFATEQSAQNTKIRSVDFEVELKIEGDTPPETATFTFVLTADDNAPLPDETAIARSGAGFADFGEINYTEAGEYHYKISERNDGLENYIYDDTVYSVDVNVNSDRYGNLSINVTAYDEDYAKEPAILFINTYDEEPDITPSPNEPSDSSEEQTTTSQKESKVKAVIEKAKSKLSPNTGNDSEASHNYRIVILCATFVVLVSCVGYLIVAKKRRKNNEKL